MYEQIFLHLSSWDSQHINILTKRSVCMQTALEVHHSHSRSYSQIHLHLLDSNIRIHKYVVTLFMRVNRTRNPFRDFIYFIIQWHFNLIHCLHWWNYKLIPIRFTEKIYDVWPKKERNHRKVMWDLLRVFRAKQLCYRIKFENNFWTDSISKNTIILLGRAIRLKRWLIGHVFTA